MINWTMLDPYTKPEVMPKPASKKHGLGWSVISHLLGTHKAEQLYHVYSSPLFGLLYSVVRAVASGNPDPLTHALTSLNEAAHVQQSDSVEGQR